MTPRFFTIFRWQVVRNLRRHRLLAALNVVSIALGIAVYLAIQIANGSANRSFAAGVDLVAGKAHLEVRGDIDETLWPQIAHEPGIRAATGVIEGIVTLPDLPGEYLRIVGIDLFTNEPFRTFEVGAQGERVDFDRWLAQPGGVALTKEFAQSHGIKVGSKIRVLANSASKELTVLALLDPGDSPAATQPRFAAMDIGWAQELLGTQGRLQSLQLLLEKPNDLPRIADALRAKLPVSLAVEPPRQRSFQMQQMLSAFQLNLTALSMVSLLVGTFLIYTTVSASVTRRRGEIAVLRSLGATRLEVRSLFLGEACCFGLLGSALGIGAGIALASGLVSVVAKTISSLYLLVSIDRLHLGTLDLLLAIGFGIAAVILGAWLPAGDATRIDPVASLSLAVHAERSAERVRDWRRFGAVLLLLATLLSWMALRFGPAWLSFAAAFCVLAAFSLFAPGATVGFARVMTALGRGVILLRLAAENLGRSVHRNGITVAALASAIAMMAALMIMIFSFRSSVDAWVARGVVADLFVASGSNETIGLNSSVPAEAIAWLRQRPEVFGVDTFRETPVNIGGKRALLAVVDGEYRGNMEFDGGDAAGKMARVFAGEAVAVTESFARKFRVHDGDEIELATPRGRVKFRVAGVYADYTRDEGVVLIARPLFARFWSDTSVQSLSIYLRADADAARVAEEFRQRFSRGGELSIYSNRALRQRILAIFDQTFAVTYVLRTVAVFVALVGIFLSVTTLVAERTRALGVLRAIGASAAQIQRLLIVEAAMIGVLASALGLAAGALLAGVLTWVVNPAFFGWTITLHVPWLAIAMTPVWIVPASIAAAWLPAWRATRAVIAESVREE